MKDSKVNTVNYNKCVQNERQQGKHTSELNTLNNKCVQNERQQGKHSEL